MTSRKVPKSVSKQRVKESRAAKNKKKPPAAKGAQGYKLPATADITSVSHSYKELAALSRKHASLVLDAGDVQKMTTPFLQLIIAAEASCASKGGKLTLQNVTPPVEEAFSLLGMWRQLTEWRG